MFCSQLMAPISPQSLLFPDKPSVIKSYQLMPKYSWNLTPLHNGVKGIRPLLDIVEHHSLFSLKYQMAGWGCYMRQASQGNCDSPGILLHSSTLQAYPALNPPTVWLNI